MEERYTPHVVIVGGGFAGLYVAKRLKCQPAHVTLQDRCNYQLFQSFLYQVATIGLSPGDIAAPIRSLLRCQRNTTVLLYPPGCTSRIYRWFAPDDSYAKR